MKGLIVQEISNKDFSMAQSFYELVGYSKIISDNDRVVLATLGDRVVGVSRICSEENFFVLRGMQVEKPIRK